MNARFENYAREQFSNHQVEVDAEALWANVYPEVKKDNRGKKGLWIFLSGLLIGILGFGVFYFNQDTSAPLADDSLPSVAISTTNQSNSAEQNQSTKPEASTILASDLEETNYETTDFNKADEKISPTAQSKTTLKSTKEASKVKTTKVSTTKAKGSSTNTSDFSTNLLNKSDEVEATDNQKPIDPNLI